MALTAGRSVNAAFVRLQRHWRASQYARIMADNFNYISFGNRDLVDGEVKTVEMSRGRMFEYTPTDIEKRLEKLDGDSISFLEKLPTFLCSEFGRASGAPTMMVKFGTIKSTTADRKLVQAGFETLIDFGDVMFSSMEHARDVFSATGGQLYRTHWAIREGDVRTILEKLAALQPVGRPGVEAYLQPKPPEEAAEPPPRAKKLLGRADSVETFLQLLYRLPAKGETETFFRGHENATFELTPSLLRKSLDGAWQFMPSEHRMAKEILIAHYDEFQADQYCFDRLVRMQHYGLPTRLLDISGNPLVALFFACHSVPKPIEADGEVIVFRVEGEKIKYYDSDTVSCLANLSNLTYLQKNDLKLSLSQTEFNQTPVVQKLLHHIKSEKGFFEPRISPDDLGSIVCVKAKRTNTRIKSQAGAFLLYGHEATLPEEGQEGIEIHRITITNKAAILDQLDHLNINATTVYPSIQETAGHLRYRYLATRQP